MANTTGVHVEGLNQLVRNLRKLDRNLLVELKEIHRKVAEPVATTARVLAPKRTGRLAGSIKNAPTQRAARVTVGGRRVPYAPPVHWGWPSRPNPAKGWRGGPIKANPFLVHALDQHRDDVVREYQDLLDKFINRTWESYL